MKLKIGTGKGCLAKLTNLKQKIKIPKKTLPQNRTVTNKGAKLTDFILHENIETLSKTR